MVGELLNLFKTSILKAPPWKWEKTLRINWDKVFKNELSKICGRQPLKKLKCKQTISLQIF